MSIVSGGPGGLEHTPVLKAVFGVSTAGSLAYMYSQSKKLSLPNVALLSHPASVTLRTQLVFTSFAPAAQALLLLYNLRIFERRMRSRKFAAFALLVLSCCAGAQGLVHTQFESGPFGLVFALFASYLAEVPAMLTFSPFGSWLQLSEKSILAGFALQARSVLTLHSGTEALPYGAMPCSSLVPV